MKLHHILATGILMLSFVAGGALAADKAAQQAEIRKVTAASLEKFYKARPEIKATGLAPNDRVVSQQLSAAYERRMGR